MQSWLSTDLSLHEYKTTTTCPQKQSTLKNTQKSTRGSQERPQTKKHIAGKELFMKQFEAKVLFRQIPGILTALGKGALIGSSVEVNTNEEKTTT